MSMSVNPYGEILPSYRGRVVKHNPLLWGLFPWNRGLREYHPWLSSGFEFHGYFGWFLQMFTQGNHLWRGKCVKIIPLLVGLHLPRQGVGYLAHCPRCRWLPYTKGGNMRVPGIMHPRESMRTIKSFLARDGTGGCELVDGSDGTCQLPLWAPCSCVNETEVEFCRDTKGIIIWGLQKRFSIGASTTWLDQICPVIDGHYHGHSQSVVSPSLYRLC